MPDEELLLDRAETGVAVITLNRPESHNALTIALQRRLDEILAELAGDGRTRCIVLTGAGDAAFCSGYDLHEMAQWDADELLLHLLDRDRWLWNLAVTPVPIVTALGGIAYGAGALIAAAADVRVGHESTWFRFTAAAYGGANATWSLPRIVGAGTASELLLSARPVAAEEAHRIGLLNRIVPRDALLDEACGVAAQIASNPAAGTRAVKRLLREHLGRGYEERFQAEGLAMRTELRPRRITELYGAANGAFQPSPRDPRAARPRRGGDDAPR